ncbi:BREX-1 system adenine-specific DNA-methyltransferase PglX, partial [Weissella cibaria]|nr:BREX-1 system adenine-specific DNA-methyltransferase PglX [Weissella cibaria]
SVTSSNTSFRYLPKGFLFSSGSNAVFTHDHNRNNLLEILALANSNFYKTISEIINSTLNTNPGDVGKVPLVTTDQQDIIEKVTFLIKLAKADWDSFENSWDFNVHPLIHHIDEHNQFSCVYGTQNLLDVPK